MSKARELANLGNVYDDGGISGSNLLINGNMEIAQRGSSQTTAGYGSIDRFVLSLSGATATMSQESFTIGQTDVAGSDKYLKLDVTTGNNNSGIYYKVEAKDAFPAINKQVTLSYYAKGTSPTNGLEVAIAWYDGSTLSSYASTTVTLTSTWTKYTHTFDVPSISGLTLTNASAYLELHWGQADTDTGTAAYEVNLAQAKLEIGDTATPFEHRSYGDELARCQRYCLVLDPQSAFAQYGFVGWCESNTAVKTMRTFPVTMRSAPSFSRSGSFSYDGATSNPTFSSQVGASTSVDHCRLEDTVSNGNTGQGVILINQNDATAKITFDAEL